MAKPAKKGAVKGNASKYAHLRESNDDRALARSEATLNNTGRFGNIFSQELEIPIWNCKEGDHLIDILPWAATENHPVAKEGDLVYNVDLFVHVGIGPTEDSFVCPSRNFKKPCPICEYGAKLAKQGEEDDDVLRQYKPTRRMTYNVVVRDGGKEEAKGVQLFHVSHYLFENALIPIAKNKRTGERIPFYHTDRGKSISFSKEGKQRSTKFVGMTLEDREEPITDEILDQVIPIEDYIVIPSYDEIKKAFTGDIDDDPVEEEEAPRKKKKKQEEEEEEAPRRGKKKPDPEPEEEEEEEESSEECPHGLNFGDDFDSSKKCKKCKLRNECEEASGGEEEAEEEEEEEEEETPTCPVRGKTYGEDYDADDKKCKKCPLAESCSVENEEEEEEEEEESSEENECPHGKVFGQDTDTIPKCGKCPIFDDCAAENDKRRKEMRKKRQGK